jgi:hypothetical protein
MIKDTNDDFQKYYHAVPYYARKVHDESKILHSFL